MTSSSSPLAADKPCGIDATAVTDATAFSSDRRVNPPLGLGVILGHSAQQPLHMGFYAYRLMRTIRISNKCPQPSSAASRS